jgi:hypothetical protein
MQEEFWPDPSPGVTGTMFGTLSSYRASHSGQGGCAPIKKQYIHDRERRVTVSGLRYALCAAAEASRDRLKSALKSPARCSDFYPATGAYESKKYVDRRVDVPVINDHSQRNGPMVD